MIQLDLFFLTYSYIIFNFDTLHVWFRHLFLNTLNNQASVLYQLVGRRRFCFEKLEKHYWSSGIEFLYLKTPLGTELLNTSDTYNTILEKRFYRCAGIISQQNNFRLGSILRRTHAMIFCFKGEKVSKCVKVFINWILSGVANRQYVIYGFF